MGKDCKFEFEKHTGFIDFMSYFVVFLRLRNIFRTVTLAEIPWVKNYGFFEKHTGFIDFMNFKSFFCSETNIG